MKNFLDLLNQKEVFYIFIHNSNTVSIIKSNNAGFEITLDWLRRRGYNFYDYRSLQTMIKEGDPNYSGAFWAAKSDELFQKRKRIILDIDYDGKLWGVKFYHAGQPHWTASVQSDEYDSFLELEKLIDEL